ncbi:isocitrate lyase/PEP mutase family protein [Microbacterium sp.]|uniref:isocitrate lyase/PEP mutase family protein n=1 Tax=Microbacterium sp. TaxID=51671 RepID=UPI003A92DE03
MTKTTTLRRLIAATADSASPLLVPGGGTPLEMLAAQRAGFQAYYQSGYAVAAWRHGLPDLGLLGAGEIADALAVTARVAEIPIIVDADTGYGDASSVHANVRLLEGLGASAIQIEDQAWPKKCGHMVGKTVIDIGAAAAKVRAAVEARRDPETVIIARTDAISPLGFDEGIARAVRFAEAGADVVFLDAPESEEQLAEIGKAVPGVVMINMSESGLTPILPAERLRELGFRIVLYPTTALRISTWAMTTAFADIAKDRSSKRWFDRMHSLDDLNHLVGIDEYLTVGDRAETVPA